MVAPSKSEWVKWVEGKMRGGMAEGTSSSDHQVNVALEGMSVESVLAKGFGGKGLEYEARATDVQLSFERWVLRRKETELFAAFKRTFALVEEPGYTSTTIHQLIDPNMKSNRWHNRFSDLTVDETTQSFMVSFELMGHDKFLETQHKEQVANATAGALINKGASKQPSRRKKKSKKKSNARAAQDVHVQPPITTVGDFGPQMQDIHRQVQALTSKVDQLAARIESLEHKTASLWAETASLWAKTASLRAKTASLWAKTASLQTETANLKDRVTSLESTVKAHDIALMATLHCSQEMPLFAPSAIRDDGNIAAHQASKEDLSHAILDVGWTARQRKLFAGNIYIHIWFPSIVLTVPSTTS
ncbi:hypothetical protein BU15DRAFT_81431 [Melanogaster broomeanus]|nr:hypothetical protein BU15DRAFT_81431 [Melanogaster broomeanus]